MSQLDRVASALRELVKEGGKLLDDGQKADCRIGDFAPRYESWYTRALASVSQVAPERVPEFKEAYKHEKRKSVTYDTYAISDFLLSLRVTFGGELTFDPHQAFAHKILRQVGIVGAAADLAPSVLRDIRTTLRSELLDSDIVAARELLKAGHLRSAGVVCGVVLEAHLLGACERRSIKVSKKDPGINDLNEILKASAAYDVPMWRFIQRLADIRNLCGHKKDRDPRSDEVADLIDGADKVVKEVA